MKAKLFPVLILLISLFSCNEEDLTPEAKLQGSYQSVTEVSGAWGAGRFDYVNTFDFRSDGTFYREDVTRNPGSDEVLGHRMYGSGTYTVIDGIVKILYDELYVMNVVDVNYWPKEGLILTETDGNYEDYSILENYKKLEYVCPPNAFCISLPYIKVQ
jgi:hypothetical protein